MSNRAFHVPISAAAGAAVSLYKSHGTNEIHKFWEAAGGAFGGAIVGILPDRVEPPIHPGHRSTAHALTPAIAAAALWTSRIDIWQTHARQLAAHHAWLRAVSSDPLVRAWHAFAESFLRILAGFIAGFAAGYVTHLAFDFGTPNCRPRIN